VRGPGGRLTAIPPGVLQDTHPGFWRFGSAASRYDRKMRLIDMGLREYDSQTTRWTVTGAVQAIAARPTSAPRAERPPRRLSKRPRRAGIATC
jgi:hypothetical protein